MPAILPIPPNVSLTNTSHFSMDRKPYIFRHLMESLDRRFLLTKPVFWSTRLLRVLLIAPVVYLILAVLSYFGALDPRSGSNVLTFSGFYIVISLLFFVWWMIYLLRFNVFKRFGQWNPIDSLIHFLAYFLTIALMVFLPVLPVISESFRANRAYTTQELIDDANAINRGVCLLERDSINLKFKYDTIHWSRSIPGALLRNGDVRVDVDGEYGVNYYVVDSNIFFQRLQGSDSNKVLNDSIFIDYNYPDYVFVSLYNRSADFGTKTWDSRELFKRFLANPPSFDRNKERETLFRLLKKYDPEHPGIGVVPDDLNRYAQKEWQDRISQRLSLYDPGYAMNQVMDKKWQLSTGFWETVLYICYYFTLGISLLVFFYRHNTRNSFFLSILAALVLAILTGLFMASTRGDVESFITTLFVYFVIFSLLAFLGIYSGKRKTISAIGLNLAVTLLPLIPLMITTLYYRSKHEWFDQNKMGFEENSELYHQMFGNESLHMMMAQIGGFVLLVILIPLLIGGLYRKWYALPED